MNTFKHTAAGVGRREVITAIGAVGTAVALRPLSAFGQARRPLVAGAFAQPKATNTAWSNMQDNLKALGWVEGQNITFEWRFADNNPDRYPALIDEVLRLQPDVFYTGDNTIQQATKQKTATVPLVSTGLGADPAILQTLLGPNMSRPAFNVTGTLAVEPPNPPLPTQRTLVMKQLLPAATRFGYGVQSGVAGTATARAESEAAAKAAGVTPVIVEIRSLEELPTAYQALARERVDAQATIAYQWQPNLPLVTAARLPTIYGDREAVAQGGLIAIFAATANTNAVLAAGLVDKILKGAKVADLAPLRPPQLQYKVAANLGTAKALGLTIPAPLLNSIDEKIG